MADEPSDNDQSLIDNEQELCEDLGVDKLEDVDSEELRKEIANKLFRMSPDLLKQALNSVPELLSTIRESLKSAADITESFGKNDRERLKAFTALAQTNSLTQEQLLEIHRDYMSSSEEERKLLGNIIGKIISMVKVVSIALGTVCIICLAAVGIKYLDE